MPLLCLHCHKYPRHVTSRLWRVAYDENMCGPIRTCKCRSTNWLINYMKLSAVNTLVTKPNWMNWMNISVIITQLIVIKIAPLTELFCNCPLLKDISFNTKFLGLVWLTSNHMFGSGDFWDKPKFSKMHSGNLSPYHPPKYVNTSTNWFNG